MEIELRANDKNPNHLSVAMVVFKEEKIAVIKRKTWYILPAETIYLDETLENAVTRGAKEELGIEVQIEKFIGSRHSVYGNNYRKTSLYFVCKYLKDSVMDKQEDELEDEVLWVTLEESKDLLKDNTLDEVSLLHQLN